MRYFSTDELDFGDDDRESPPSRSRSRYAADDAESRDSRDDFDRGTASDDIGFNGGSGDGPRQGEAGGDNDGGDRRPKRRRRRRRRPDGTGPSEPGAPNRGADGYRGGDNNRDSSGNRGAEDSRGAEDDRNFEGDRGPEDDRDLDDNRGLNSDFSRGRDENRGSEANRNEARNDARGRGREPGRNDGGRNDRGRGDSGRPQGSNRHDSGRQGGGRGRRPGGSSGSSGGNRGRSNEGTQPRGGASSRDSGGRGGRDRGMPRRNSRQVQPSVEIVEGTFDGVLELHNRGYGFLRDPKKNYAAEDSNPFVSSSLVEKYKLREGVLVRGDVGNGTRNQGPRLREVELIDGYTPEAYADIKVFDTLTAINPFEQIRLEVGPKPLTMRVMDLLCPIGKGQRALLVAPPRTGKTMLLQDIANSVSINHPEIYLMVLLIDERPEEVTEMRRMVKGEVISSSLDSDVESHVRISQLIIERAKRLAEEGKDVFILLDSITRMARAFNKWSNTGRTATGGLDIRALDIPKKLFGQARRFDEGGSLTVCGTALIDTGSRMDEAIFQEFKGTGNMEMVLSRELADRRIWPSIDISKSGTRREEKILDPDQLDGIIMLRRSLVSMSPVEAMEQLTKTMDKFPTNAEFLKRIRAVL
ncbi:MAG: transcription termination factor Rho [Fuerstia sp.]|nr:transcription termination factor Rho [Fuerstiella sp.]